MAHKKFYIGMDEGKIAEIDDRADQLSITRSALCKVYIQRGLEEDVKKL